jgi:hypothetical protein
MACAARTWPLLNPARSIVGTSTAVQIPIAQLARGFRLPRTRCADELRASPKTEEKWAAFSVVTRRRLAHVGYRNRRLWTSRRLHPCADCASAPSRAPLRALWPLAVGGADRSRGALMILGSSGLTGHTGPASDLCTSAGDTPGTWDGGSRGYRRRSWQPTGLRIGLQRTAPCSTSTK